MRSAVLRESRYGKSRTDRSAYRGVFLEFAAYDNPAVVDPALYTGYWGQRDGRRQAGRLTPIARFAG